jgi:hypothetical protein
MSERQWDDEFEEIVDDSNQNPIQFYEDENVGDRGSTIAEGETLREVLDRYERYRKLREDMEEYG